MARSSTRHEPPSRDPVICLRRVHKVDEKDGQSSIMTSGEQVTRRSTHRKRQELSPEDWSLMASYCTWLGERVGYIIVMKTGPWWPVTVHDLVNVLVTSLRWRLGLDGQLLYMTWWTCWLHHSDEDWALMASYCTWLGERVGYIIAMKTGHWWPVTVHDLVNVLVTS